ALRRFSLSSLTSARICGCVTTSSWNLSRGSRSRMELPGEVMVALAGSGVSSDISPKMSPSFSSATSVSLAETCTLPCRTTYKPSALFPSTITFSPGAAWRMRNFSTMPRRSEGSKSLNSGEMALRKVVDQRHLLGGDLRRGHRRGGRDVAECAIQIFVLGGDAGRLRRAAAGQLLVRADREQLDLLLRAAGEQICDRSALASEFLARDHFFVMRGCGEVLGLRREDRVVGERLGLVGRKVRIELRIVHQGRRRSE